MFPIRKEKMSRDCPREQKAWLAQSRRFNLYKENQAEIIKKKNQPETKALLPNKQKKSAKIYSFLLWWRKKVYDDEKVIALVLLK